MKTPQKFNLTAALSIAALTACTASNPTASTSSAPRATPPAIAAPSGPPIGQQLVTDPLASFAPTLSSVQFHLKWTIDDNGDGTLALDTIQNETDLNQQINRILRKNAVIRQIAAQPLLNGSAVTAEAVSEFPFLSLHACLQYHIVPATSAESKTLNAGESPCGRYEYRIFHYINCMSDQMKWEQITTYKNGIAIDQQWKIVQYIRTESGDSNIVGTPLIPAPLTACKKLLPFEISELQSMMDKNLWYDVPKSAVHADLTHPGPPEDGPLAARAKAPTKLAQSN